jgi:lipid kinase YegS
MEEVARVLVGRHKFEQNRELALAIEQVRAAGRPVELLVIDGMAELETEVRRAVQDGCARVVAAGGDGTLGQVAQALAATSADTPLGIVPLGTGNDFARAAGIPLEPEAALRLALDATPRAVDLGRAGDWDFLNMGTAGFGTSATVETDEDLKGHLGSFAYLLSGLAQLSALEAIEARLHAPDLEWTGAFFVLAIGNGRTAGGGIPLCPDALLDDGLLDVTLIEAVDLADLIGGALGDDADGPIRRRRVPWLELETGRPIQVNLDGEPLETATVRFECRRHALRVCLPPDAPLAALPGQEATE